MQRTLPKEHFMVKATLNASLIATAALLTACANSPATNPTLSTPLDERFTQNAAQAEPQPLDIITFWRAFNDPVLTNLVEQALQGNVDVKLAQARLREAEANAGEARAGRLPSVGLSTSVARVDPPGAVGSSTQYSAGGNVNWELDFFGRNRRASDAAAALVTANQAGVGAAQRVLTAELATQYLNLRGQQLRLRVAQEALMNQRESLRIVTARQDLGRGTPLDVARARALVESTEASIPALQAQVERSTYRLATLTGQPPRGVIAAVAVPAGDTRLLPTLPFTDLGKVAAGTPQTLLIRRPDVRVAQAQWVAASANTDVARADLFPRISLTGLLGFTSNRISNFGDADSRNNSAGAFLTWPLLDFGRVRSRIAASETRALQALLVYEQTVLLALEETESALAQFNRNTEQTQRLENAAIASEEAARLARIRFEAGASDFLTVLDAERSVLQARDALVQAQTGTVVSLVGVYRALGGGWGNQP
jgi:multidrug efflux system outer membrane protein